MTGSKISRSSTKFWFFGSIRKTRWPPGLWLPLTISTSPLQPLSGIQRNYMWPFWPLVISNKWMQMVHSETALADCVFIFPRTLIFGSCGGYSNRKFPLHKRWVRERCFLRTISADSVFVCFPFFFTSFIFLWVRVHQSPDMVSTCIWFGNFFICI